MSESLIILEVAAVALLCGILAGTAVVWPVAFRRARRDWIIERDTLRDLLGRQVDARITAELRTTALERTVAAYQIALRGTNIGAQVEDPELKRPPHAGLRL